MTILFRIVCYFSLPKEEILICMYDTLSLQLEGYSRKQSPLPSDIRYHQPQPQQGVSFQPSKGVSFILILHSPVQASVLKSDPEFASHHNWHPGSLSQML